MLQSAAETYAAQARIADKGTLAARRAWRAGRLDLLTPTIAFLMASAARHASESVDAMVAEQRLNAPAAAAVSATAFARSASDGRSLSGLLQQAESLAALVSMVVTQIADSGRVAGSVSVAARPALNGYVRHVGPTCCSRCAILAGRFYRWSSGFQRHPACRCLHVPTTSGGADELIETPDDLFRQGRITGLSASDVKAINDGADLNRVVNVRRDAAGLTEAGRVLERRGRLMPEGIYRLASDRDQALDLLQRSGFIL